VSYEVKLTDAFERMLKRVAKQHPDVIDALRVVINSLEQSPTQGTPIGKSCYKIRIPLGNKGKRGGGRLITYVLTQDLEVYLLAIYSKNSQATLRNQELEQLLKKLS
jgi:mRNA-degrading endonuclease RelE of RelBE toxin-antitoxin system